LLQIDVPKSRKMAKTEKTPESREREALLIVADDLPQLRALSALFEKEGFQVACCRSTSEAIEQLESRRFAVAVMDLCPPNGEGSGLFETLQASSPETRIIVYTGFRSFEFAKNALNQGVFAYVEKASPPAELVNHVHRAIQDSLRESLQESGSRLNLIEERYPRLIDELQLGVAMMDTEHNILMVNEAVAKMRGKPTSEIVGQKCFREFENRQAVCGHCPGVAAMAAGEPAVVETSVVRDDGSTIHLRNQASSDYGPDGEITGFIELIEDVTERKRAENALRESKEHFATIFKLSPIPASLTRMSDANLTEVNDAWCGLMGISREEAVGHTGVKLGIVDHETRAGLGEQYSREGFLRNVEVPIKTQSGEEREILTSVEPLRIGGDAYAINLIVDITERRRAEEALAESEARYRELVDNMSSGVAVYRAVDGASDFVFVDFNKSGGQIDRVKSETLVGKRVTEVFPGVKEFGLLDVFQRVWRTGVPEHHPVSRYEDNRITGWRDN